MSKAWYCDRGGRALAGTLVLAAQDLTIHWTGRPAPGHGHSGSCAATARRSRSWARSTRPCGMTCRARGMFRMVPKTMYPKANPAAALGLAAAAGRAGRATAGARPAARRPQPPNGGGLWLSDWSGPPVSANYLAFGYTAVQNGVLVLYGWLYDLGRGVAGDRQPLYGQRPWMRPGRARWRTSSRPISSRMFGGQSLFGTHIYFSVRPHRAQGNLGDGSGRQQSEADHEVSMSITIQPARSRRTAARSRFTSCAHGNPGIFVFSVDPVRDLRFYNQRASVNSSPSFTPDGKQIVYSSSAQRHVLPDLHRQSGRERLAADLLAGLHRHRAESQSQDRQGDRVRVGPFRSAADLQDEYGWGRTCERLTSGEGEASNPSWHPDGQIIAFAWTRGFATGNFNIFTMDVATRQLQRS